MGMLTRFDLSTDFTQFFVAAAVLTMVFTILLSRVAPGKKKRKGRGGRVDDRFANTDGELID